MVSFFRQGQQQLTGFGLGMLRGRTCFLVSGIMIALMLIPAIESFGQATSSTSIEEHLTSGEFPKAIEIATTLDRGERDHWLAQISQFQMVSGATDGAYQTAGMIGYDSTRTDAMSELSNIRRGGGANAGSAGGVTLADFQPLIDLIQNTVQPDTWLDTGQGLGTIQAYPAGVFVDPSGTLKKIKTEKVRGSTKFREQARIDSGNRKATWKSDLRKISLTRLEKAALTLAAQGKSVNTTMLNMAGVYEIKYLMIFPDTGDIVIAGPAGPWELNKENRPVNVETGKPVLQLDDLVVCLRNAWENNGKFGCSITPRKANLVSTKQFLASTKLKGKRWAEGIRDVLGQQDVEVFGIDSETHAARVLVESDYRMKLLGMGLEETIPEVPSYLDRLKLAADGSAPPMDVVRWWFTLNYDDIVADDERTTFTFNGTGVKVLSENEFINDQGERIHTGQSNAPTKGFARDFTKHFDELATKYPVYRQLKNVFDLALVANLIRDQNLSGKAEWHRTFFGPETPDGKDRLTYHVRKDRTATQVDSVLNDKVLKYRRNSSTIKHHIVGVSGGISYNVHDIISKGIEPDTDGELSRNSKRAKPDKTEVTWWWD